MVTCHCIDKSDFDFNIVVNIVELMFCSVLFIRTGISWRRFWDDIWPNTVPEDLCA